MKNIIVTIALFLSTAIVAQGQIVVKFKDFYNFSHDTSINTFDAFSKNLDSNMGSFFAITTIYFDTVNMVYHVYSYNKYDTVSVDGVIYKHTSLSNDFGALDYGFLIKSPKRENPATVSIFQNTPTQKLYMEQTTLKKLPGKYVGLQAVIVDSLD
jgi:hypothetical protein